MPRDLAALAQEDSLQGMPELTHSPEPAMDAADGDSMFRSLAKRSVSQRDALHPYTQTLSPSDIESCLRVEEEAFPPNERCTREKFQYRLRHCGELSLGIFTSLTDSSTATAATSAPVYSGAPKRKSVLLGHVIATKTTTPTVTDAAMAIPPPSSPSASASDKEAAGHQEAGRTICIHSLAVLPEYQGRGLGRTLMRAYLQRIGSHGVADRAALIAHEGLVGYYEGLGFTNEGKSAVEFAGGGWVDMVKILEEEGE
ncbi:hypothetical protein LTR53_003474 [Teratosphaeriaceae sp. CCFEE 6253]|nr:hypothetical protein LTR53_003474 [Teratosphaeriaceae sp. CCFEE 6253]